MNVELSTDGAIVVIKNRGVKLSPCFRFGVSDRALGRSLGNDCFVRILLVLGRSSFCCSVSLFTDAGGSGLLCSWASRPGRSLDSGLCPSAWSFSFYGSSMSSPSLGQLGPPVHPIRGAADLGSVVCLDQICISSPSKAGDLIDSSRNC